MTLVSDTDTVSGAYYNYKVWPLAGSGAERGEERESKSQSVAYLLVQREHSAPARPEAAEQITAKIDLCLNWRKES